MREEICDTDWQGRTCRLMKDGKPVYHGQDIENGYLVVGGRAPHKPDSSGRIRVQEPGFPSREFFPHVFNAYWERVK